MFGQDGDEARTRGSRSKGGVTNASQIASQVRGRVGVRPLSGSSDLVAFARRHAVGLRACEECGDCAPRVDTDIVTEGGNLIFIDKKEQVVPRRRDAGMWRCRYRERALMTVA